MAGTQSTVNDVLIVAKNQEVQRGMVAEMCGDRTAAEKHLLAAAHLELVLADDYTSEGNKKKAFRSRLSAASAFWRAGCIDRASGLFAGLTKDYPENADRIEEAISDLEQNCPPPSGKKKPARKKVQ